MRNAVIRFCNSPNAVPYLASLGNEVVIRIDHKKRSDLLVVRYFRHGLSPTDRMQAGGATAPLSTAVI